MNTEEARKVMWLKSNPRPLGELMSEGYLTEERLKWAVQWAYNPKLKEAAKVLLEANKPAEKKIEKRNIPTKSAVEPLVIGMSLDKARATSWPLPPYKGQTMGSLVESKQVSLKDLGYIVENAWEEKVKQAAITLSLMRLEQVLKEPPPSAGFIQVISGGRSYSERKQSWLTFIDGMVFGLLLVLMIFSAIFAVKNLLASHPEGRSLSGFFSSPFENFTVIILIAIMVIGGFLLGSIPELISKRLNKKIDEYRRGQEGEGRVVELIIQVLDGNWQLFRNIGLPGRNRGDLDLVLVGPPGVWVLEVKNFRGEYRNIGDNWENRYGKKWKKANVNPSQQAHKNALRLANFSKADNLNVFVNAAVVWANEGRHLFVENPQVAVWTYNHLADELGNIWQVEKLSGLERKKITEKLSKLCDADRKKDQSRLEAQRKTG